MSIFDLQDDEIETAASTAAPAATMIQCVKCSGSGRWVSASGYSSGPCFTCKGTGETAVRVYKHSAETRAANRVKVADRKAKTAQREADAAMAKFSMEHPARAAWLEAQREAGNEFAASLAAGLLKFGRMTDNQLTAIDRAIERDAAKNASGVEVSLGKIEAAFEKARARGLKARKIKVGELTFKPAKETSANPGAIYVTDREGTYLGKVLGGKLFASRECQTAQRDEIVKVCADPLTAAIEFGRATGRCAICAAELTDPESVANGIGPICKDGYF